MLLLAFCWPASSLEERFFVVVGVLLAGLLCRRNPLLGITFLPRVVLIAAGSGAGSRQGGGSRRGGQGSRRGESHRPSNGIIIEGVKAACLKVLADVEDVLWFCSWPTMILLCNRALG